MYSFRSYYFKNNQKKITKKLRNRKKTFFNAEHKLRPSLKLVRKPKVRKKLGNLIGKRKFFRLATVYLFCGLLIIPLFSLISTVDKVNEKFSSSLVKENKKEGLPEIILVNQEEKDQNNSEELRKPSKNKLENLENPNEFIDKDKIGDLLDEENNHLSASKENPLLPLPSNKAKSFLSEAKKRKNYKIKSGDSLWTLAKKNNVSLDSIISLNEIKLPHQLREGDSIAIPTLSGIYYRVKKGDNLYKLAKKYRLDSEEIKKYNQLGSFLNIGEEIFLPGARLTSFEKKLIFGRLFIKPVEGKLSSNYGMRFHPIRKKWLFHTGIDIVSFNSKKIKALNDGIVSFVGKKGNYGNYIKIKHQNGYESAYAHLENFFVRKGQKVKQGQTIAIIGNTGLSTGPHLHLEIKHNGKFINPKRFISYK